MFLFFVLGVLCLDVLQLSKLKLGLPLSLQQKIHAVVRYRLQGKYVVLAALPIGILVTLFELPCSGYIYVPFLTHLFLSSSQSAAFWLNLTAYNLFFILPLVAIILSVYMGAHSVFIKEFYRKHAKFFKIAELAILGMFLCFILIT